MNYDKLKNLKLDTNPFSFTCPHCNSDGMKANTWSMRPIGIAWKPDNVDNSDIPDAGERRRLNQLPTLRQALLQITNIDDTTDKKTINKNSSIIVNCNKCNMPISNEDLLTQSDIRKWVNKNIPSVMNLKLRPDQIEQRRKRSNN